MSQKNDSIKSAYLRDAEIFQDLTTNEVDEMAQLMPLIEVAAQTVFYTAQNATESIFLIKEGRVRLYYLSAEGKTLTTAILEKGTFFGEMALLGQRLYGNFAETVTDCKLCLISREDLKKFLLADRRIAFRIVETLGQRLLESEQKLADITLKHVPARVASLLLQLASKQNTSELSANDALELHFTHEQLGQLLGIHRETITRTLKELSRLNYIQLHRGRIVLLDADGLLDFSAN